MRAFNMITWVRSRRHQFNSYALPISAIGLVIVAFDNWRLWWKDRAVIASTPQTNSVSPLATWPDLPKVSALVAAWNEAEGIEEHIQSFHSIHYPNKELILCAGGQDGTYDIACQWVAPNVKVLEQQPGEGKQHALQRCFDEASGTVIVLSDADCLFANDPFLQIIEPLVRGKAQVATGMCNPKLRQRHSALIQYQWFNDLAWSRQIPELVDGVLGGNCALRRDVLENIDGFNVPVQTGTDYFMSRRLVQSGYKIYAVPECRIATEYPQTPDRYLQRWRRWNKNLLIHGLRFGAWKDVKGIMIAFAFASFMLFMPILAPILGLLALLMPMFLFATASLNRLRRMAIGSELAGSRISWRLIASLPFYTLLDMLAVLLAVYDFAHPRLRSRW